MGVVGHRTSGASLYVGHLASLGLLKVEVKKQNYISVYTERENIHSMITIICGAVYYSIGRDTKAKLSTVSLYSINRQLTIN